MSEEKKVYEHCFVSDLHCGSLYFDMIAFRAVVDEVVRRGIKCKSLHVVGDVVEGKLNHKGQLYEAFPLDIQEELAVKVIEHLLLLLGVDKIHIVPGNHDRKYSVNLLDHVVDRLKGLVRVEYHRDSDFYAVDNILVLHSVGNGGGSSYTGITPMILTTLDKLKEVYGVDAKVIVVGHYHKYMSIQHGKTMVYLLPSFQYTSNPLREVRGMLFLSSGGEVLPLLVQPSRREEIVAFWRKVITTSLFVDI